MKKQNVTCPKCGKVYRAADCFECVACSHEWNEGNEMAYQSTLAQRAAFDRNLRQVVEDGKRLMATQVEKIAMNNWLGGK